MTRRALRAALAAKPEPGLVLVRRDSGGVFPDGTTNHPAIDFDATAQRNYDDCDCVPGHRCDCWDYRAAKPEPGLDVETLRRTMPAWFGQVPDWALYEWAQNIAAKPEPGLDAQSEALLKACAKRGITSPFDLEVAMIRRDLA